jgi:hypothetical protein
MFIGAVLQVPTERPTWSKPPLTCGKAVTGVRAGHPCPAPAAEGYALWRPASWPVQGQFRGIGYKDSIWTPRNGFLHKIELNE